MLSRRIIWCLLLGAFGCVVGVGMRAHAADTEAFPPPAPPTEAEHLGEGVQRTMTLLATSTQRHRNRVRILFYGQSITEQDWSRQVADDLRRRFPSADLEIENRAIGGFAAQLLIRPAEHDLYPFYPDLLIFHVYGSNKEYEEIIRNVRSRTAAEVLMQKDHVTQWPAESPDPAKNKGLWWDDLMNRQFLPDIAGKYGCGLVDIRSPWLDYLKTNHLEPAALLKDGVHLNEQGNFLMAHLVSRYLSYRPELPRLPWKNLVRTVPVAVGRTGEGLKWRGGKLSLDFDGNRVDVLAGVARPQQATRASVFIDGKLPSRLPNLYRITRPNPGPWSPLTVTRVDHTAPLIPETWTMKVTSVNPDSTAWSYSVSGSRTGADGSGSSAQPFVSRSGRVKIAPEAFFRNGSVPGGYEIRWQVLPTYEDSYQTPVITDASHEYATVLAQGLENGPHMLVLLAEGGGTLPIKAIRVYRPPCR